MFRKSGIQKIEILSGAGVTPFIRVPEMAGGVIICPAGFTGIGSASIYVGYKGDEVYELLDVDGVTAITITLAADAAIVLPPEAFLASGFQLALATAVTKDEVIYLAHKS